MDGPGTFGLEEFLLVDPGTGRAVPAATEVGTVAAEELGDGVHAEL